MRARRRRSRWLPSRRLLRRAARGLKRAARALRGAPPSLQALLALSAAAGLWFAVNGIYQVLRKPSELFFPVSGTLNKTPAQTWRQYAPLFRRYSTPAISPELLAALAQVEGSGNPVVRTYWRWSFTPRPFDVYRPASSAVGMYQITDGTFAEARRFCIHRHVVVEDGAWNDWRSCWFNRWYTRVLPSDAVELTSAYLDRAVATALQRHHARSVTAQRSDELASVIHLCGAGAGDAYVRRGLKLAPDERCGDHVAADYVARVAVMKRVFHALEAEQP